MKRYGSVVWLSLAMIILAVLLIVRSGAATSSSVTTPGWVKPEATAIKRASDQDGIDDACNPLFGSPPLDSSANGQSPSANSTVAGTVPEV